MKFGISKEEQLMSKVLKPGWYICKIKDITVEKSKTDGSENTVPQLIVQDGAKLSNGSPSTGVPLRTWFSEKFKSEAAISFANVLAGRKPDSEEEVEVELTNAIGKLIKVYVSNGDYKGKVTNVIERFGPAENK